MRNFKGIAVNRVLNDHILRGVIIMIRKNLYVKLVFGLMLQP